MEIKLFEVRDSATLIPAFAIKMESDDEAEAWLLRRAGYGGSRCIMFGYAIGSRPAEYDPFSWPQGVRTMPTAHKYVYEHWDKLKSGDVICVETILGERTEPKVSERLTTSGTIGVPSGPAGVGGDLRSEKDKFIYE